MTGARNFQGGRMGDYDDGNQSSGIIGTIISILILAAIWPYLLAILGLYIAYVAAVAVLEWMSQNLWTVAFILLTALSIYVVIHYRLIPKAWKWLIMQLMPKASMVNLDQAQVNQELPDLTQRKFIPSTDLYCYWCTKKLGRNAWEKGGKYYCDECKDRVDVK